MPWSQHLNKNVFSSRLNCPKLMSVCLRWAGRLFHSVGPAAAEQLSPHSCLIIGILSLCTSAHLTVLSLFNPALNLTFSLLPITSSHPHASTSDLTFDCWRYINIWLTLTLTSLWTQKDVMFLGLSICMQGNSEGKKRSPVLVWNCCQYSCLLVCLIGTVERRSRSAVASDSGGRIQLQESRGGPYTETPRRTQVALWPPVTVTRTNVSLVPTFCVAVRLQLHDLDINPDLSLTFWTHIWHTGCSRMPWRA